jgi:hypothetical protein
MEMSFGSYIGIVSDKRLLTDDDTCLKENKPEKCGGDQKLSVRSNHFSGRV